MKMIMYGIQQTGTDRMLVGYKEIGQFEPFADHSPVFFDTEGEANDWRDRLVKHNEICAMHPDSEPALYPLNLEVVRVVTTIEPLR